MNQLDAFEQRIRDVLEPFEVPYNSADWAQMEKALDSGGKPSWWSGMGLYAALFAGALAVGTSAYLLTRDGTGGPAADVATGNGPVAATPGGTLPADDPGNGPSDHDGGGASTLAMREGAPEPGGRKIGAETGSDVPERSGTGASPIGPRTSPDDHGAVERQVPSVRELPVPEDRSGDTPPAEDGPAEMTIRPSVTEGCPGTTVEFAAEHLPEEGIFLWNFGDGSFSNKPNPSHTYSKSGRFEVMLSHSSMAGGNIRNKPSSDLIVIHEAPEGDFVPQRQSFDGHLPSVHFENRSLGGKEYHWDFGDGVTSSVPHPDHVFRRKGTYHVELVVTNARGCVDRVEKEVVVEHDYNLLAPEAFSPNGDGTNDLFIPEALRELELRFKLSIHDPASGDLVYETTDASKPWTGRVMNRGDLCAPGTYVWVVEFPDALHLSDIPFQGEVTLVR